MTKKTESPARDQAAPAATGSYQRNLALFIVNASHLLNHVQSTMLGVLYPVMMQELGFGYFEIGILQTVYQLSAQGFQVVYGFLARFFPRSALLGFGTVMAGLFTLTMGFTHNFTQVFINRMLAGTGSSVQHPVGAAILISYFEKARGRILTLFNSAGTLGGLIAPALVGMLLFQTNNWRLPFYVVAVPSLLVGLAYFILRDVVKISPASVSKKQLAKVSIQEYIACFKNRNVMLVSLIQMAGAAGRGTGINVAFLTAFFMAALGVNAATAAGLMMIYQVGSLLGPLGLGWLYDRYNRKLVVQLILLGSTITTLWLLEHHSVTTWFILNLVLYGAVVNARGSLTQGMVSEAVPLDQIDVAFSIYFFIGFISGPIWTFITGWLIDTQSFAVAFRVVSVSYLVGMLLLAFASGQNIMSTPARKDAPAPSSK